MESEREKNICNSTVEVFKISGGSHYTNVGLIYTIVNILLYLIDEK